VSGWAVSPSRAARWLGALALVAVVGFTGFLLAPFVLPGETGASGQSFITDGYPSTIQATGEDGRTRTLSVSDSDGEPVALDQVSEGDRLIVTGRGFDSSRGIYVAICQVPDAWDVRPGPCLGGIPLLDDESGGAGSIEWGPSNWINQEWAWRLFGARSYDSGQEGSFTAYLVVPPAVDEQANCQTHQCGVYTRNDHTAIDNRMQDLYVRLEFSQ